MAKNLENLSLFDITPSSIIHDKNIQAIIKAIDPEFQSVSHDIREALIFSRIDELPETLIDLLAWERHVDFYEPDLGLKTKRELVKNSISWHRIKGTPAAVEQLVSTVFGNGKVSEWFEYNGRPYFFTVAVDIGENNSHDMDAAALAKLRRVIKCAQNARSWLEFIELINDFEDFESSSDEFIDVLNLDIDYHDYYPYISHHWQDWFKHDGALIRGGSAIHSGRFTRNNFLRRRGFFPENTETRTGSAVNIDDLILNLNLKNPFYDNYSQVLKPERNGVFIRNGILKRVGGESSKIIITLPVDWRIKFLVKNNLSDSAKVADSGELSAQFTPKHRGDFMHDGSTSRGVKKYYENLRRMRRNASYTRRGEIYRQHDVLPIAI